MWITSLEPDKSPCSRPIQQLSRWLLFHHPATMPFSSCLACFFTVIMKSNCRLPSEVVRHRKTQKSIKVPTCYTIICFTTIAANLAIRSANLPLSIRVPRQRCSRQCVAQCLSQLVLWKNIFFDVDVVVKSNCASWVHNILTTVMTRIVVDKSTDHAKPHSTC